MVLGAVYGVPDPVAGDRAMAALQLNDGVEFDPAAFAEFLAQQSELGPKWVPTFVRVVAQLPLTQTNKVLKRELVTQRWDGDDPVWMRTADGSYRRFDDDDRASLTAAFVAHGRQSVIER